MDDDLQSITLRDKNFLGGGMHSITFDILQDSLLGLKHAAVIMTVGDTGIISKKT